MKKIGVAVKENGKKLEHFGVCEYFIIYTFNEESYDIEYDDIVFSFKDHRPDVEEWDKSLDAVKNCDIVFCECIGLAAKAEVERRGIKVIEDKGLVEEVLDRFLYGQKKKDSIKL